VIWWDEGSGVPFQTFAAEVLNKRFPNTSFQFIEFMPPPYQGLFPQGHTLPNLLVMMRSQPSPDLIVFDTRFLPLMIETEYLAVESLQRDFLPVTSAVRNVLDASTKNLKEEIHTHVRAILEAPNPDAARLLFQQTLATYEGKAPKAMRILEAGFEDVTADLSLPEKYRKRLRTTNSVERLNEEIRRRERVIRIFQNVNPSFDSSVRCSWNKTISGLRERSTST